MDIQKSILLFFSKFRNPLLVKLGETITICGEEILTLVIALFIFWCIDKKKGFASIFIMLVANTVMSLLKAIVRFPRPWVLMPELQVERISTATGYSFPSGHSTTAASFYSALAFSFRNKALSIVCALLILLVPVSRMYLCCHWPLDVACGLILGVGTTLILFNGINSLFDNIEKNFKKLVSVGVVILACAFAMAFLIQASMIDSTAFSDFSKVLALFGGVLICYPIETKYYGFSVEGKWIVRIIRYVVGLLVALLIMEGIKKVLPYTPFFSVLRYMGTGAWACLYPLIGRKIKLFG